MTAMGSGPAGHETQPLTEPLVRHADVIYTMTRGHRDSDGGSMARAAERILLSGGRRIGRVRPDRRAVKHSGGAQSGDSQRIGDPRWVELETFRRGTYQVTKSVGMLHAQRIGTIIGATPLSGAGASICSSGWGIKSEDVGTH